MTDKLEQQKEQLLDDLINALYEVTDDARSIQRIDDILEQLEQIDPTISEPFSVEESYQSFMERFRKMEASGALDELLRMSELEEFRA